MAKKIHDRAVVPVIEVSEISRVLILVKKFFDKHYTFPDKIGKFGTRQVINKIREKLELRRRSRVSTHIRGNGKMDRRSK